MLLLSFLITASWACLVALSRNSELLAHIHKIIDLTAKAAFKDIELNRGDGMKRMNAMDNATKWYKWPLWLLEFYKPVDEYFQTAWFIDPNQFPEDLQG